MARKNKFDYFEAYEKLSELAVRESELLLESFKSFTDSASLVSTLEDIHELEHQGDDINHSIFQNAAVDFMPPIDREDIVELAQALDNVLDNVEAVLQQVYMCDARVMPEDAVRFAKLDAAANPDIAWAFNVVSVPAFVLFRDGVPVGEIVGAVPAQRIEELIAP